MVTRYSCNFLYPRPTSIKPRYVYPLEIGDKTAALDAKTITLAIHERNNGARAGAADAASAE